MRELVQTVSRSNKDLCGCECSCAAEPPVRFEWIRYSGQREPTEMLCREYICHGGLCQEHRGIMFLLAILNGSTSPEWWRSKSGQVAQSEQEYSWMRLMEQKQTD